MSHGWTVLVVEGVSIFTNGSLSILHRPGRSYILTQYSWVTQAHSLVSEHPTLEEAEEAPYPNKPLAPFNDVTTRRIEAVKFRHTKWLEVIAEFLGDDTTSSTVGV